MFRQIQAKKRNPKLDWLRAAIVEGLAELKAGRVVEDFELKNFLAECRQKFISRHAE